MADIKAAKKRQARISRHRRVRARVSGTSERPRLAVFRSLKHIYAQLIDDVSGRTLVSADEQGVDVKAVKDDEGRKGKTAVAYAIGKLLAERATKAGIKSVVFDRGGFSFAGRVAALAQGARDNGLSF
ncbi:50S ribosomal protein L18 [Candidatus Uhrbacteria bacterium CG_4_10_14_0_8_um_filter_58_22]|uniref:Large ribosomal subunit protein uL18 n=1 Tax=Candidatus Uhrbacteria bacterium CG_4_10_14_0_8_um_filter_58_22 TaxID=1975029 RepID=A0A2M7QAG6_9BACT|nr:MAG: 50S ribosomal protein L18 [Parcubacteria group bacterium CG1_02_58_44]PIY62389.1 MAG: 50S ribosomal protein L18 [Candidatus Uhrbacteria bacterium CG_4_10_14_0_8_um_filter_58_22]